jgi:hypothetical protein
MVVLFALGYFFSRAGRAPVREAETWYGGLEHSLEHVHYASHSFYRPFKQIFAFTVGGIQFEGLYPKAIRLPKLTMPHPMRAVLDIDQWLYYPFARGFLKLSEWFSRGQVGIPQVYILWIILGVIAAIAVLFALPAG